MEEEDEEQGGGDVGGHWELWLGMADWELWKTNQKENICHYYCSVFKHENNPHKVH